MNELDFIPQWYRAGRSRKLWHQRQYAAIGLVVLLVACGLLAAGRSLSSAQAKLATMRLEFESGIANIQQYRELETELTRLQTNARILETVSPRTPYTAALAELSHCVGANVVLSKLTFQASLISADGQKSVARQKPGRVQLGAASGTQNTPCPTQTDLILRGVAANGSVVAELIAAIEQSTYFRQIVPGYSKNIKLQERDVTEFEIRCVLADFEILQ
jgi:hypothetical protein